MRPNGLSNMYERSRKASAIQFMKFNAVGLLNTAIDMLLFALLVWFGVHYALAQLLSYSAGMANSYLLNSKYTFKQSAAHTVGTNLWRKRIRFVVWNGFVLFLSIVLLALMTNFTSIGELAAKLIVTAVTVVVNFYGSKRWVFAVARSN